MATDEPPPRSVAEPVTAASREAVGICSVALDGPGSLERGETKTQKDGTATTGSVSNVASPPVTSRVG